MAGWIVFLNTVMGIVVVVSIIIGGSMLFHMRDMMNIQDELIERLILMSVSDTQLATELLDILDSGV